MGTYIGTDEQPDPKKVIVIYYSDASEISDAIDSSWLPIAAGGGSSNRLFLNDGYNINPTFIIPQSDQITEDAILALIKEHIKNHGPIDELVIDGHGRANWIAPFSGSADDFKITDFLTKLNNLKYDPDLQEALGGQNPVTSRISFPGCYTFGDKLTEDEYIFLQNFSIANQINLVGATTNSYNQTYFNTAGKDARYIQFSKDGSI